MFVTETWLCIFPLCKLTNLVAGVSDHSPNPSNTMVANQPQRKRRFRFENAWLMEEEFQQTVKNNWDSSGGSDIISRLGVCLRSMDAWGKKFAKKFRSQIDPCKTKLQKTRANTSGETVHEIQRIGAG